MDGCGAAEGDRRGYWVLLQSPPAHTCSRSDNERWLSRDCCSRSASASSDTHRTRPR